MNFDFALVLVVLTFLTGVVWLFDSLFFRQRRRDQSVQDSLEVAREPVLVEYSRSLFPVLLIVLLFRSFLFEPFKIPSGSMIPSLLIGDFIVVNKYAYGLRLPVLNNKVVEVGEPERGDVAVFRYPVDTNVNFIKRVVGLPGDTVTYRDKQLYLNGERVATRGTRAYTTSDVKCSTPRRDALRMTEQLGGVHHDIVLHEMARGRDGQWVVPEGHYFVMGDNRDRSNDSREWGFVPERNLVGRAVGIWLNFDFARGCADFSRIGSGIE
ncbi:MAG: signal peptidase I [Xanthomonadales bacterium]|uniref:signal peptidase I n=1 Tax=Hydrogenophaga sp. TaxID=1904254 RepID=UPI00168E172D|nr:signal peptidase I [Hydrogenophaga sp.]NIM69838.1 signal peptidase I [Xanthomonadales bacterium]NIN32860.1 signal peptidase I [Hydrogenophaga sp.]NIN59194.1 signal peptidase I [Xanthomonadales bacterium]NIN74256.1 signal peptidase I [Xanthomonadales bacterium]NIO12493.1 signal peptidase I [Xanthomonadales bacterium]